MGSHAYLGAFHLPWEELAGLTLQRCVAKVTVILSGRLWDTKVVQDGVSLRLMSPTPAGQQQGHDLSTLLHVSSSGQVNSCPGDALLSPVSAEEPG